jgi:hypothetical protein
MVILARPKFLLPWLRLSESRVTGLSHILVQFDPRMGFDRFPPLRDLQRYSQTFQAILKLSMSEEDLGRYVQVYIHTYIHHQLVLVIL